MTVPALDSGRVAKTTWQSGAIAACVAILATCASPPSGSSPAECTDEFLAGIPEGRTTFAESGSRDVVLIAPDEAKDEPFALAVTDNRSPVIAARINFFSDGEIFKLEAALDHACRPIRRWEVAQRPGERTLQNWDTVILRSAGTEYPIRLGLHGSGRIEAALYSPDAS